jgi:hypothetical protein
MVTSVPRPDTADPDVASALSRLKRIADIIERGVIVRRADV